MKKVWRNSVATKMSMKVASGDFGDVAQKRRYIHMQKNKLVAHVWTETQNCQGTEVGRFIINN